MKRFGPGWGWVATRDRVRRKLHGFGFTSPFEPVVYCDDAAGGGGGGGGADDDKVDLTDDLKKSDPDKYWRVHWKRETAAARAFGDRDEIKKRIRDLEGRVMTPEQKKEYDDLKAAQARADEERKKKEGEWEALKRDQDTRHQTELKTRDDRIAALDKRIADDKIRTAFLAATDWFGGGETSKSVLVGDVAVNALRQYVTYEEYDFGSDGGKRMVLIVRDAQGGIIRGEKGYPAPFEKAIEPLIKSLPEKDHVLRGSGKTGSGARGEGVLSDTGEVDLSKPLTAAQKRDPKVRQQLEEHGGGGIQMGRGFAKAAALAKKE